MKLQLYSKQAIGLLALLLSPFLAAILFAYNLREIGKGKIGPLFIIGALFFTGLTRQLAKEVNVLYQLAMVNIFGSLVLTYLWDKYFDNYDFEKRNFWKPTMFFLAVFVALFLAQFFYGKK
jgi:hypothetical protein